MNNDVSPLQAFLLMAVAFVAYFLPTFIAARRKHPNGTAIFLLDLFVGWTFIGWLAALIWSVSAIRRPEKARSASPTDNKYETLEKLSALRDKGVLSEEEFLAEKKKLLG